MTGQIGDRTCLIYIVESSRGRNPTTSGLHPYQHTHACTPYQKCIVKCDFSMLNVVSTVRKRGGNYTCVLDVVTPSLHSRLSTSFTVQQRPTDTCTIKLSLHQSQNPMNNQKRRKSKSIYKMQVHDHLSL